MTAWTVGAAAVADAVGAGAVADAAAVADAVVVEAESIEAADSAAVVAEAVAVGTAIASAIVAARKAATLAAETAASDLTMAAMIWVADWTDVDFPPTTTRALATQFCCQCRRQKIFDAPAKSNRAQQVVFD